MSPEKPKIRRELAELGLLFEISQILDRSMDLRDELGPVLKAMAKHTGMLRGTIALLNRELDEVVTCVASSSARTVAAGSVSSSSTAQPAMSGCG